MTSVSIAVLMVVTVGHAQFDFEKEVAGFFEFGKIPSEFTDPPSILNFYKNSITPGNHLSLLSTTAMPVITAFSNSIHKNMDDNEFIEKLIMDDIEEENEGSSVLPKFGEIQRNLTEKIDYNVTEERKGPGVKKRSYSSGHGGGGGYGEGGRHSDFGYRGGHGGSSHLGGGGGYSGEGEITHEILMKGVILVASSKPQQQWSI